MHCRELAGPVGLAYKIIQDGKAFSSASAELSIVFAEGLRKTKAALRTAFVAFIGWRAAPSPRRTDAALLGFGSVGFEIRLLRVSGLTVRKIAFQMLIFTAVGGFDIPFIFALDFVFYTKGTVPFVL